MEIFRLFGSILVDNDKANKSLDSTDKKGQGVAKTLGSMVGTAVKVGSGIAAGVAVAGGALFALATKTSEAASKINDLSVKTGIGTTALQELKYISGQTGVNFDVVTGAVGKLTKQMDAAAQGNEKAIETFGRLGLKMSDITNEDGSLKKMDDMFPIVIKKLADMTNESERNALAMQIFGKGGMELVPILASGSMGIDEMTKKAHDLGLVMSEEAVSANDKFGDTLDDVKASFEAITAQVGTAVLPIFQELLDWILANLPQIKATFKVVFDAINIVITATRDIIKDGILPQLNNLYNSTNENMPGLKSRFADTFGSANTLGHDLYMLYKENLLPIINEYAAVVQKVLPIVESVFKYRFNNMMGSVKLVLDVVDKLVNSIKSALDLFGKLSNKDINIMDFASSSGRGGSINGYANGTNDAPGGWSIVGEKGPELMNVKKHSAITSNDELGKIGATYVVNDYGDKHIYSKDEAIDYTGELFDTAKNLAGKGV